MSVESHAQFETNEKDVRENCALVGIILRKPSSLIHALVADGLDAQQHRGEEAAGIGLFWDGELHVEKGLGLRPTALPDDMLGRLPQSHVVIGHTRYATSGYRNGKHTQISNAQPFQFDQFILAENGNVPMNTYSPSHDTPSSDTFIIGRDIATIQKPFEEAVPEVLKELNGAYMMLFVTNNGRLYVASDPWGFKPGVVGRIDDENMSGSVFTSETVGLKRIGAKGNEYFPRGTFAELTPDGIKVLWEDPRTEKTPRAFCSFEKSYFQDPTSKEEGGRSNAVIRNQLGQRLAERVQPKGTKVTEVPMSGTDYAVGIARQTGIERDSVIKKVRYAGRNFIKPRTPEERMHYAFRSFNFVEERIEGEELILGEDSIVRGNTTQGLVLALFDIGAERVEICSGMPALRAPCNWGIDFPSYKELIYNRLIPEEGEAEHFEKRLAEWLVAGKPELADRIRISFQTLEDYIEIIEGKPHGETIDTSGGCYHCVSEVAPRGIIVPEPKKRVKIL